MPKALRFNVLPVLAFPSAKARTLRPPPASSFFRKNGERVCFGRTRVGLIYIAGLEGQDFVVVAALIDRETDRHFCVCGISNEQRAVRVDVNAFSAIGNETNLATTRSINSRVVVIYK